MFKSVQEIKSAVDKGEIVFWKNFNYIVRKTVGNYMIYCQSTNNAIGLSYIDDKNGREILNGEIWDFFTNRDFSEDNSSTEQCLAQFNEKKIEMMMTEIKRLRNIIKKG